MMQTAHGAAPRWLEILVHSNTCPAILPHARPMPGRASPSRRSSMPVQRERVTALAVQIVNSPDRTHGVMAPSYTNRRASPCGAARPPGGRQDIRALRADLLGARRGAITRRRRALASYARPLRIVPDLARGNIRRYAATDEASFASASDPSTARRVRIFLRFSSAERASARSAEPMTYQ